MANWTVARAIREALVAAMDADPAVALLSEEPDGGLFGVTEGLAARYGDRVVEIAHDEASLVGAAVGTADGAAVGTLVFDLPGTDGLHTCRQIRQLPHASEIPILMITSFVTNFLETEAPAAGASGVLKKPLDPEATVQQLLSLM